MVPVYATTFAPTYLSFLSIAREQYAGSPTAPVATVPVTVDTYEPEDTPHWLRDEGLRAAMAPLWGLTQGPLDATFSYASPFYLGSEGYWLDNILGDLSTVSNGTLGPAQPLSGALTPGATYLNVTASLGAVTTGSIVEIIDGAASEIVIATTGSSSTGVFFTATPCRFAHTTSATAALQTTTSGYTHTFSLLNNGTGQPPTHSITDFTGLTAGTGARIYPAAAVTSLDITSDAAGLITAKVSGVSWLSAPAATTPTPAGPFTVPLPAWRSTVTLGGQPLSDVGTWGISFKRDTFIYLSAQNSQTPFVIARGSLTTTGGLSYTIPADESPLTAMLSAGPLPLVISASNNLAGVNTLAFTFSAQQAQALKAKPSRTADITGYDDTWEAITNTSNAGGSGVASPASITLINNIAAY